MEAINKITISSFLKSKVNIGPDTMIMEFLYPKCLSCKKFIRICKFYIQAPNMMKKNYFGPETYQYCKYEKFNGINLIYELYKNRLVCSRKCCENLSKKQVVIHIFRARALDFSLEIPYYDSMKKISFLIKNDINFLWKLHRNQFDYEEGWATDDILEKNESTVMFKKATNMVGLGHLDPIFDISNEVDRNFVGWHDDEDDEEIYDDEDFA